MATDNQGKTMTSSAAPDTVRAVRAKPYIIQTEHLNTPRLVADDTQTTVWRWEQQEPFGVNAANDDPDGNAVAFEFNLRFPGQYFDKETNAHYNYFRDYDPSLGRYVQSDPIGLRGGLNSFLYVDGDPLRYVDERGLANGGGIQTRSQKAAQVLPVTMAGGAAVGAAGGLIYGIAGTTAEVSAASGFIGTAGAAAGAGKFAMSGIIVGTASGVVGGVVIAAAIYFWPRSPASSSACPVALPPIDPNAPPDSTYFYY